jgi:regulatory protein SWI5
MLSNPSNNLHNRQRQHRRQQSTPNVFEPVKVSNLPNIQRHNSHRRGMSLDQRQRRQSLPQEQQVSITNQGYQTTQQHVLRETQQQRLARPGQQFNQFDNDENYLDSPIVTPQRQSFDVGCMNPYAQNGPQAQFQCPGQINTNINGMINVDSNFNGGNDFNLYGSEAILTPSAFLDFSAGFNNMSEGSRSEGHSRRSSRRISGGILDRVTQFENLALQSPLTQRPMTPPNQNVEGKLRRILSSEDFTNSSRIFSAHANGNST